MTERVRKAVRVEGIVQGVGFRPFVYGLATGLSLGGLVGNDPDGVFAEVEGTETAVGQFLDRLARDAPPLARVDRVRTWGLPLAGSARFTIVASRPRDAGAGRRALVSPDTAPCADCLRELADPADRRFGYPFINCTNCGPRFTIVRDVPYDRARTTMAGFAMCAACAAEYRDPADRRFHAEPTCCPACGPCAWLTRDGTPGRRAGDVGPGSSAGRTPGSIAAAAALLRAGAGPGRERAGRVPPGRRRGQRSGGRGAAGAQAPGGEAVRGHGGGRGGGPARCAR